MPGKRGGRGSRDRNQILDVAERLVQSRGFNGFSYADIAAELGITKASLHYHFPGKAELGEALIARYARRFAEALAGDRRRARPASVRSWRPTPTSTPTCSASSACACAGCSRPSSRPSRPRCRTRVVRFFDENETWLERVLEQGAKEGALHYEGRARDQAQLIISTLEGAMLVARPYGDPERFRAAAHRLLATLDGE